MPMHMVADDLATGRLVKLDVRWPDGSRPPRPVAVLVRRRDKVLGPAGEYLAEQLVGTRALAQGAPPPRKGRRG
jgi:DNA-binding transcriptional LysR family regulator